MGYTRRFRRERILEEKAAEIALTAQEIAMTLVRDTAYQKLRGVARTWAIMPALAQAGSVGWAGFYVCQLLALAQARFFELQLGRAMQRLHDRVSAHNERAAELLNNPPEHVATPETPGLVRADGTPIDAPRLIHLPGGQTLTVEGPPETEDENQGCWLAIDEAQGE